MPPIAIWSSAPVTLSGMTTPWHTSEDCLYLNMWVPPESTLPASGKWPVYVWIHGSNGDILQTRYLGDELAKKGILYILPARRQGVFAGLALAELSAETENKGYSGNFDLLDEIFALQWVHDNIAKFGGDPDNVTLSGQSGGSRSSARLQASPLAKGLFKRILAQSHTPFTNGTKPRTPTSLADAEGRGAAWMAKFGTVAGTSAAATVAELRGRSTAEILLVSGAPGALAGGICLALPDSEEDIFLAGKQNDVPIYIGSDYDEGNTSPITGVTDLATYNTALSTKFGADASAIFNFYPAFNNADAVTQAKRLNADYTEGIQELAWARLQKMKGKSPVYMWSFRRANSVGEVRHGWENPYWHGKLTAAYANNTYPYTTAADYQLSERMMDSLVSYCRTGNPNTAYVTVPEYRPSDEKWVAFDAGAIAVVPIPASVGYFLDNLGKW
jgi:para-nitrobenzyl esterase